MRLKHGESDKFLGKVENAERFANVKEKTFAAVLHGCGLENEINRFRNGHKKTIHIGMRDRDRTAICNLIFENGNDTTATAEDISKANNGEGALGPLRFATG